MARMKVWTWNLLPRKPTDHDMAETILMYDHDVVQRLPRPARPARHTKAIAVTAAIRRKQATRALAAAEMMGTIEEADVTTEMMTEGVDVTIEKMTEGVGEIPTALLTVSEVTVQAEASEVKGPRHEASTMDEAEEVTVSLCFDPNPTTTATTC